MNCVKSNLIENRRQTYCSLEVNYNRMIKEQTKMLLKELWGDNKELLHLESKNWGNKLGEGTMS